MLSFWQVGVFVMRWFWVLVIVVAAKEAVCWRVEWMNGNIDSIYADQHVIRDRRRGLSLYVRGYKAFIRRRFWYTIL